MKKSRDQKYKLNDVIAQPGLLVGQYRRNQLVAAVRSGIIYFFGYSKLRSQISKGCPLLPQEQTLADVNRMSALRQ